MDLIAARPPIPLRTDSVDHAHAARPKQSNKPIVTDLLPQHAGLPPEARKTDKTNSYPTLMLVWPKLYLAQTPFSAHESRHHRGEPIRDPGCPRCYENGAVSRRFCRYLGCLPGQHHRGVGKRTV